MAKAKELLIKESVSELKKLHKQQPDHLKDRIRMLLYIKRCGNQSKRVLASATQISHTSIQTWRLKYEQGGIKALLEFHRHSNNPSIIPASMHKKIKLRLTNPTEAPTSYEQLRSWVSEQMGKEINYQTLNGYVKRNFNAKLKVARKSHVNKDAAEEAVFKNPARRA